MLHSSRENSKINHLRECSLRIVYRDNNSFLKINLKNTICSLFARKIFRHQPYYCIMSDILQTMALTYNLSSETDFAKSYTKTWLNSLFYFASKSGISRVTYLGCLPCK